MTEVPSLLYRKDTEPYIVENCGSPSTFTLSFHPSWLTKHALVALPLLQALPRAYKHARQINGHALLGEKRGGRRRESHNYLQYLTARQSPKCVA